MPLTEIQTHWLLPLPQECQVISHSGPFCLLYPLLEMFPLDFLSLRDPFSSEILFPVYLLNNPFMSFTALLTIQKYLEYSFVNLFSICLLHPE